MPLALSDRTSQRTFDDRNNMALLLILNLIDTTYARFAFWIVFTSRLVGILVIPHPPLSLLALHSLYPLSLLLSASPSM